MRFCDPPRKCERPAGKERINFLSTHIFELNTHLTIRFHICKVAVAVGATTERGLWYARIDGKINARSSHYALINLIVHILVGGALLQMMLVLIAVRMRLIAFLLKLCGACLLGQNASRRTELQTVK